MNQEKESLAHEISTAIERAFAKIDAAYTRVMDGEPAQDTESAEALAVELPQKPEPVARPPRGRVLAVGPSADWWPHSLQWVQPGEALVLVSLAFAWLAVTVPGTPMAIRLPMTFWFVLACPGFAALRLLQFRNPGILATLSLAASIGIDTVLSEVMLYTHTWSPGAAMAGLAGFSLAALVAGRRYQGRFGHALS